MNRLRAIAIFSLVFASLAAQCQTSKLLVVKQPNYHASDYPNTGDYMRVLERFPLFAERGWHPNYKGMPDVGYFGDPDHGEMGLRSMGNFIFTCALLASDPAYDPQPSGVSQERLLDLARRSLRYMTRAHVTGDLTCGDGAKWGDHWQSAWWTGKMAAGARLIWDRLTPEEQSAVERVVVHEADRHLPRKAPSGATSDTKSEENAWDTEALSAAISLFPSHPNAPKWRAKLIEFHMNTLSRPADKQSSTIVDGRPVREQVYTANIHDDFTIENHGAYHFCYMACPLHSRAWGWYALQEADQPIPESLLWHYQDVWNVIRKTFLYDNRFAYISGKDWPRYAYGLYFIMPACVMMQEVYGDRDARLFERGRFESFEREQIMNSDGAFFGRRFTANNMLGRPLEFETDAYANLGVCYLMHKMSAKPFLQASDRDDFQRRVAGTMISSDSGWSLGRSPKVFTGFSWRELGGPLPTGLFIPAECDDMAEWGREQFSGNFDIEGYTARDRVLKHNEAAFDGGFWTVGRVTHAKDGRTALYRDLAFISLPDEGIALLLDRAVAASNINVISQEGLRFHLANDIFNAGRREIRSSGGAFTLWGGNDTMKTPPNCIHTLDSKWLNVDGKLSFIALTSNSSFAVRDMRGRSAYWEGLEYELIDLPYITQPHSYRTDGLVRYSVVLMAACDARSAKDWSAHSRLISSGSSNVRCALLSRDGRSGWLVAMNLGDRPENVTAEGTSFDLAPMSAEIRAYQ